MSAPCSPAGSMERTHSRKIRSISLGPGWLSRRRLTISWAVALVAVMPLALARCVVRSRGVSGGSLAADRTLPLRSNWR